MMELLRIAAWEDRRGLKLSGEVDISNSPLLAETLFSRIDRTEEDFHLDLSELRFIDASGVRVLTQAAKRLASGRQVVLWFTPGHLRRLIGLLRIGESQGLRLAS